MKRFYRLSSMTISILMGILFLIECIVVRESESRINSMIILFFLNLAVLFIILYQKKSYEDHTVDFIRNANEQAENSLSSTLEKMPIGVIRYKPETYEIEWFNPYVDLIFGETDKNITSDQVKKIVEQVESGTNRYVTLESKQYTIRQDKDKHLLYLLDASGEFDAKHLMANGRAVIGALSVDNYDEATDLISESERTAINSIITNSIDSFSSKYKVFTRRVSSDRYYFFTDYQTLEKLMQDKFSFTEEFKKKAEERNVSLTYSIGVGYGIDDFQSIGKTALNNLELALVRGGDQVVVKENIDSAQILYFGGNSASRSQRSRTRARAIATALNTIISESENVFVVGHKFPDMDALGASVAMRLFANLAGKEAYVVYDKKQLLPDVQRAIAKLDEADDGKKYIITTNRAKAIRRDNSLLIMVDHSKTKITLNEEFYKAFDKVVVIDHHRRDEDFPNHAMLSYIESGASSASELATELLQYQTSNSKKMNSVEASVTLAGISVDTKSFSKGATSRTFEAASFLRGQGADSNLVKNMLATDFNDYKAVNEIILNAEFIENNVVIACGDPDKKYDSVKTAIAAETLADMANIKMAFGIAYHKNGYVAISARSRGDNNVQKVMTAFGGGGHFNNAAAQVYEKSIEEVKEELIAVLNDEKPIEETQENVE
ncbi:RecJ-like protein [Floricoccus tropicus]|uniref:Cyclic-di-AMP phosphodiesterase n=1 Tax=Floricoccus tropicus TaxID=1859473 RepID=A0A1E8GM93_9LACT|nr:DHH family phosphoesterase [Floricoccus tropicus]OFI48638.1 RecJ-like protein [Floricoccus tropicus]